MPSTEPTESRADDEDLLGPPAPALLHSLARPEEVDALLAELSRRGGLEFDAYQRESLLRRIARRMALVGVDDLAAYRALVRATPAEFERLCESVPVHRTEFFRDPDAWAHLAAEVLPGVVAGRAPGEQIRAWSAGCATGEEAYTLAMLLAEAAGPAAVAAGRVRVFATDVSASAIDDARRGRYRAEAVGAVPRALRETYFRADGDDAVARPELRRLVVFCQHDLLRTPAPPQLDLVACRNVLIYFVQEAQERALSRTYLAMREGAVLFSGVTEHLALRSPFFAVEGARSYLCRSVGGRRREALLALARRRRGAGPGGRFAQGARHRSA